MPDGVAAEAGVDVRRVAASIDVDAADVVQHAEIEGQLARRLDDLHRHRHEPGQAEREALRHGVERRIAGLHRLGVPVEPGLVSRRQLGPRGMGHPGEHRVGDADRGGHGGRHHIGAGLVRVPHAREVRMRRIAVEVMRPRPRARLRPGHVRRASRPEGKRHECGANDQAIQTLLFRHSASSRPER